MSYILDALRKSDQQRRRGSAPTLLLEPVLEPVAKRPAYLVYALVGLSLLVAGVAIGWLRPWQSKPEHSVPVAAVPKPVVAAQAESPEVKQPVTRAVETQSPAPVAPKPPTSAPVPKIAPVRTPPSLAPSRSAAPAQAVASNKPEYMVATPKAVVPSQATERVAAPVPSAPAAASAAKTESTVTTLAELPLAIQQELPAMSISVHAYSTKPTERLVGINGRLLREGDEAAPGLRLEQIAPDGMIFTYKGYRFRRGVR